MLYVNLFLIAVIVCFIVDISGAIDHLIAPIIKRMLDIPQNKSITIPLLSCSLCCMFWSGLIYIIITNNFSVPNIAYVCMLAFLTKNISGFLRLIQEVLIKIEDLLYDYIN